MKLVVIGAGHLGYHLAVQLAQSEKDILVANHQENVVLQALQKEGIPTINNLKEIPSDAEVYVLCVKDDCIAKVVQKLIHKVSETAVVLHTSGAVPSDVLQIFKHYGVLYPLYSFSFSIKTINWKTIPFYYVANDKSAESKILQIAKSLNGEALQIQKVEDAQKLFIHLLAVFANNFTNALMHSIYELSQSEQSQVSHLYEQMTEFSIRTIQRTKDKNPAWFQTGPAIRKDNQTIKKHIEILKKFPDIQKMYQCFTEYIQHHIKHAEK